MTSSTPVSGVGASIQTQRAQCMDARPVSAIAIIRIQITRITLTDRLGVGGIT